MMLFVLSLVVVGDAMPISVGVHPVGAPLGSVLTAHWWIVIACAVLCFAPGVYPPVGIFWGSPCGGLCRGQDSDTGGGGGGV